MFSFSNFESKLGIPCCCQDKGISYRDAFAESENVRIVQKRCLLWRHKCLRATYWLLILRKILECFCWHFQTMSGKHVHLNHCDKGLLDSQKWMNFKKTAKTLLEFASFYAWEVLKMKRIYWLQFHDLTQSTQTNRSVSSELGSRCCWLCHGRGRGGCSKCGPPHTSAAWVFLSVLVSEFS